MRDSNHTRSFQRRLDQLKRKMTEQAMREEFRRPLGAYLQEMKRRSIALAIEHSDGDLADAAQLLGVPLAELQALLQQLVDDKNG